MEILRIGKQIFYGRPLDFTRLRVMLARAAEIPITKMHIVSEEGDDIAIDVPDLSGYDLVEKNIYGEWDTPPDDPILVLLAHSDEKGNIQEDMMLPLVERIVGLEPYVHYQVLDEQGLQMAQKWSRIVLNFANMLADAYAKGWDAEFKLLEVHDD